jgi:hypothetical protein
VRDVLTVGEESINRGVSAHIEIPRLSVHLYVVHPRIDWVCLQRTMQNLSLRNIVHDEEEKQEAD